MTNVTLPRLLDLTKALANGIRLRILGVLASCPELCVGQVAAVFDMARSTASEHLSDLRRVGLLTERRDGRFVYYSLAEEEAARTWLRVVLADLEADRLTAEDRALAARIRALPHDLVCELGRGALAHEPDATGLAGTGCGSGAARGAAARPAATPAATPAETAGEGELALTGPPASPGKA